MIAHVFFIAALNVFRHLVRHQVALALWTTKIGYQHQNRKKRVLRDTYLHEARFIWWEASICVVRFVLAGGGVEDALDGGEAAAARLRFTRPIWFVVRTVPLTIAG